LEATVLAQRDLAAPGESWQPGRLDEPVRGDGSKDGVRKRAVRRRGTGAQDHAANEETESSKPNAMARRRSATVTVMASDRRQGFGVLLKGNADGVAEVG
jgi:hypothetical protein